MRIVLAIVWLVLPCRADSPSEDAGVRDAADVIQASTLARTPTSMLEATPTSTREAIPVPTPTLTERSPRIERHGTSSGNDIARQAGATLRLEVPHPTHVPSLDDARGAL